MWIPEGIPNLLLVALFLAPLILADEEPEAPTRFEYYSKHNPSVPTSKDDVDLKQTKKVIFYIHGWNAKDLDESGARRIKDGIFEHRKDVDVVILVDWCEVSNDWDYFQVAEKYVPKVARNVKNEVDELYILHGINTADMEMVAHSLGAHVMGQSGRLWKQEGLGPPIGNMTALDAAGPWFKTNPEGKISKDDATFVRGIHTDPRLGIFEEIGHQDIYPYTQDVILDCEGQKILAQDVCLHRAAKDLYLQELAGATLVDPNDPTRGKERSFTSLTNPLGRSISITVLVLDVSPSMQEKNRMPSMITATKRYIKSLPIGTFVGIVIFGGQAYESQVPTNITDEDVRNSILTKVPTESTQIYSTSIGAGLLMAIQSVTKIMKSSDRSCPDIILITDGEENCPPYRSEVESQIPKCMRVYPIALGDEADKGLEDLGQKTNGLMASASDFDSLDRLTQTLQDSRYAQMDRDHRPIKLPTKEVEYNDQNGVDFLLDKGLGKDTQFFISTPDYDEISPTLTAPDGQHFLSADFSVESDLTGRLLKLPQAVPGTWNLKVGLKVLRRRKRSHPDPLRSSRATVFVTTMQNSSNEAPIRLEGLLSNNRIDYESSKKMVNIQAKVRKGDDLILGAKVEATLTSPKVNGTITLALFDNGIGADGLRDDGIYTRQIFQELVQGSRYEVSVTARSTNDSRIMPANYISFMPPNQSQKLDFELAYPFERQAGLGSVKAISPFKPAPPNPIEDLQIGKIDRDHRQVTLVWTASGEIGDLGTATLVEIRANTNYSQAKLNQDSYVFNDTDVVAGSLEPFMAGKLQKVTLEIPGDLWDRSAMGHRLYFVVRTGNNNTEFGQDSNIASAFYALFRPEPQMNSGMTALTILMTILTFFAIVLGLLCILFLCT